MGVYYMLSMPPLPPSHTHPLLVNLFGSLDNFISACIRIQTHGFM